MCPFDKLRDTGGLGDTGGPKDTGGPGDTGGFRDTDQGNEGAVAGFYRKMEDPC